MCSSVEKINIHSKSFAESVEEIGFKTRSFFLFQTHVFILCRALSLSIKTCAKYWTRVHLKTMKSQEELFMKVLYEKQSGFFNYV